MPRIPFADVEFPPQDLPSESEINKRLRRFLCRYRENMENPPDELLAVWRVRMLSDNEEGN